MTDIKRREFLKYAGLCSLSFSRIGQAAAESVRGAEKRPNVIVLLSDEHRWQNIEAIQFSKKQKANGVAVEGE